MNASDDATRQQPTGGADGHDCCGGDKSKSADRVGPPRADADKAPARERPSPKVLETQRTSGAGCGCGH